MLELARLGVAARPGAAVAEASAAVERLGFPDRTEVVEMPEIEVSSTEIRRRIVAGERVRYLVPDPVIELIAERGLYREAVTA